MNMQRDQRTPQKIPVWLLLLTLAAYLNALPTAFQFDDYNIIVDNTAAHSLAAWWHQVAGIRPLLKLSYVLNWISGLGAPGFHAVNLLLHLINVVLLWRLSAFFPHPEQWNDQQIRLARLLSTLLFALHPVQTEAVTYVSGRSMPLMGSFGLAALLSWLLARRSLALLLFAAAILSKEVAVVLPLALLLLRADARVPRRQALWLALYSLLALLLLFSFLGYQRLLIEPLPRGLTANLASEANALFYLLGQLLRPLALNIDPDLPELATWSAASLAQAGIISALLLLAWSQRRDRAWITFGIGWCALLLLPTYSLIPRLDLASERHLYLSAISLFWLTAIGLTALLARLPPPASMLLITLLAFGGTAFTAYRNQDYCNEISLWQATLRLSPDKTRAWNNLGYAHALAGQSGAAWAAFRHALQLDPGYFLARVNLANLEAGRIAARPFEPSAICRAITEQPGLRR